MDPAEHVSPSPALIDLARAYAISPEHYGFHGEHRSSSAETLIAVLAALGVDASTPERIDVALASIVDAPWRRMLPATLVLREGQAHKFPVHVTDGMPVEVWIELEGHAGRVDLLQIDLYTEPRTVDGRTIGRAMFEAPRTLPDRKSVV